MIDLREYLLIDYDFVTEFMKLFKESLYGVILLFFVIAILFEIVSNGDILGVIKRVFLCIIVITVFSSIHHFAVNKSFDIANEIANKLSENTALLKGLNEGLGEAFDKRSDLVKESGAWTWIKYNILLGNVIGDTIAGTFVFLAKLILVLVKAIYTVVHNIGYGLIAIPSIFCIFSQFKGSLSTAMKTTAWCVSMPFVVLFLLMILSWQITHSVVHPMDYMAVTMGFLIMLLMSGGFTFGLLSGAGVMGVAAIGGMVLSSQISSLASKPISWLGRAGSQKAIASKSQGVGKGFKNSAANGLQNLKEKISPIVQKNKANLLPDQSKNNPISDNKNYDNKYSASDLKAQKQSKGNETVKSTKNETRKNNTDNVTASSNSVSKNNIKTRGPQGLNKQIGANPSNINEVQTKQVYSKESYK